MISRTDFRKEYDIDVSKEKFEDLEKQGNAEYNVAWKNQKAKKDEQEVRLMLYNNQKRDKEAVGDTTMFTTHQTVLAFLYMDRLTVNFAAKEQGDEEVVENLNALARNDYDEMEKDILDYDWTWNTTFFGRSCVDFSRYLRDPDKNLFLPVPRTIDPIPFLRFPYATSINGNRIGEGSARYFGWEENMSKQEMEDHPHFFDDIDFKEIKHGSGMQSLLRDAMQARDTAQGRDNQKLEDMSVFGANAEFTVTKWYTHYILNDTVKKVIVWLANDRAKVIGIQVLKNDFWPVLDRPLYPHSHDWDGTSIPDLTEDKQRARAIAQNLGLKAMKADLHPMYIYDSNKITNRNDLNFGFDKFIPVDGKDEPLQNALLPMIKAHPNMQLLDFIHTTLDISAQKATATPDIQQGIQSEKDRPLGETNLIQSNVSTRYSLSAKVFGWSEKRFWGQHWYGSYKENLKEEIDEKVLRIVGAFGPKWRPLKRDNIVSRLDPDVTIESQVLSRAKQLEERNSMMQFYGVALQEPTVNRRYGLKNLGKLHGMQKDEIDHFFPPTVDEREAEEENEKLNKNETVEVLREQDHNTHLIIHGKANDTPAAKAHIMTHTKALMIRRTNPEFFPENPEETAMQAPGSSQITPPSQTGQSGIRPIQPSQTSNSPR